MNVSVRAAPISSRVSPSDMLSVVLSRELAETEAVIAARMESSVGLIPDVAHHLVDAGGKRLRPMLTLAAASACGGGGQAAIKLAAAIEFIHTATLLHDDVVDGSDLRRGKRVANLIWGDKASVLVGDFLFARAFNLMVETGSLRVLNILASASSTIAEGEVMQLAVTARGEANKARYMDVITAKTATLFQAACEAGALTATQDETLIQSFARYGLELGLAFQLVDDALDYGGTSTAMGKNVGDDFREGKATLPLLIALENANDEDAAFWQTVLKRQHQDSDLPHALALMAKTGAVDATLRAAYGHVEAAKAALHTVPDGAVRSILADLADFVLARAS